MSRPIRDLVARAAGLLAYAEGNAAAARILENIARALRAQIGSALQ